MKLLPFGIALIACVTVFAQDQAIEFTAYRTATGIRVSGTLNDKPFAGTAASIQRDDKLKISQLKGNVEITINGVQLQADEVDIGPGVFEMHGNVHIKLIQQ
jgi:lipopolysaccharide export system protein LptA